MQVNRSLGRTSDVHAEIHPQLLRSAWPNWTGYVMGNLLELHVAVAVQLCLEHHLPVAFRDHAARLIPTAGIRAAAVARERTPMQFVPRRAHRGQDAWAAAGAAKA
jgi:hypothetical protein